MLLRSFIPLLILSNGLVTLSLLEGFESRQCENPGILGSPVEVFKILDKTLERIFSLESSSELYLMHFSSQTVAGTNYRVVFETQYPYMGISLTKFIGFEVFIPLPQANESPDVSKMMISQDLLEIAAYFRIPLNQLAELECEEDLKEVYHDQSEVDEEENMTDENDQEFEEEDEFNDNNEKDEQGEFENDEEKEFADNDDEELEDQDENDTDLEDDEEDENDKSITLENINQKVDQILDRLEELRTENEVQEPGMLPDLLKRYLERSNDIADNEKRLIELFSSTYSSFQNLIETTEINYIPSEIQLSLKPPKKQRRRSISTRSSNSATNNDEESSNSATNNNEESSNSSFNMNEESNNNYNNVGSTRNYGSFNQY